MITVNEGQTARTGTDLVYYPNINSCLTVTCVCRGPLLVGGHAVLIPEPGQQNVDQIVGYIDTNTKPNDRQHLYLLGDTGTWDDNLRGLGSRFGNLQALAAGLGMADKYTEVDISGWTNGGGMVEFQFSPLGFCFIRRNGGGQMLRQLAW
jgi:hypothetical protein